jgi:hypothetical protein
MIHEGFCSGAVLDSRREIVLHDCEVCFDACEVILEMSNVRLDVFDLCGEIGLRNGEVHFDAYEVHFDGCEVILEMSNVRLDVFDLCGEIGLRSGEVHFDGCEVILDIAASMVEPIQGVPKMLHELLLRGHRLWMAGARSGSFCHVCGDCLRGTSLSYGCWKN